MPRIMVNLGAVMTTWRIRLLFSQEEMASMMGIQRSNYANFETGRVGSGCRYINQALKVIAKCGSPDLDMEEVRKEFIEAATLDFRNRLIDSIGEVGK